MAGTVSFAGVGSGLDVNAIISGLTAIDQQPITAEQTKSSNFRSAVSSLTTVGSLMGSLSAAATALNTAQDIGSYTASSSDSGLVATASGNASPATYAVAVTQMAQQQRTYSNSYSSASAALGLSGTLNITVGTGTPAAIDVTADDTLNSLVDKINASGLRVSATTFYDGSKYRLQVSGLDTGAANAVTFGESQVSLGLSTAANTKQKAQDAQLTVDGYQVTSATNQVNGAIPGVSLAITAPTTGTAQVSIASNPSALETKLNTFVSAYNSVVTQMHNLAGYGTNPATAPALAANPTLATISRQLTNNLLQSFGTGQFNTIGSIGLNLNDDGTLSLDTTKLETALSTDPSAVTNILAGSGSGTDGLMNTFNTLINNITDPNNGELNASEDSMTKQADALDTQVAADQARLAQETTMLQAQFTAMDTLVSGYQTQLAAITSWSNSLNVKA
jgi:flagellar hook-associated protein 2